MGTFLANLALSAILLNRDLFLALLDFVGHRNSLLKSGVGQMVHCKERDGQITFASQTNERQVDCAKIGF